YTLAKSTSSLLDASNVSTIPLLLSNEQAQALEPLRVITSTSEQAVTAASDLTVQDIILSWSYVTQSTADVLAEVRTIIRADTVPNSLLVDTGADSPMGAANLFAGTLSVPYYLSAAASTNDPSPLASFWKGAGDSLLTQHNLTPVSNSTETIPLLVSVPKTASGAVPTVIYQHGITTNRGTVLAIADSFAANGFAVVAIDMPLHGLTGNEINGTEAFKTGFERTFDLDLVTQDATGGITAATPDGTTDSSGRHFINLSNLQNSRDNVRQAVSDLFSLTYALTTMNAGGVTFDTSKVYFLGHSLGGMVGLTFLALEPADSVQDAVIAMSGGGIAKLLDGSAAFGPSIAAGLAAQQVIKGTPEYESFMGAAQTVLDSGDPINYAEAAATGRGILFFEVVGGSGVPSDTVIPNTVPDTNDISGTTPSPLSGTDPLTRALGLTQYNETTTAVDLKALVKFSAGDHGSILSPAANSAVTVEMQTQAVTFFASDLQNGANTLSVSNSAIIAAP
ncbi:MAG: alpha/beta fold hydrolase, partial [Gammaproteobacteria bacterium]